MVSHRDVARAFIKGKKATGSRMYTENKVIYSYGDWFPIAHWIVNNIYLFNNDNYSVSTTKHQNIVWHELCNSYADIIQCDTGAIRQAIDTGRIEIYKDSWPEVSIDKAIEILKCACKRKGMKRFPAAWLTKKLKNQIILERI